MRRLTIAAVIAAVLSLLTSPAGASSPAPDPGVPPQAAAPLTIGPGLDPSGSGDAPASGDPRVAETWYDGTFATHYFYNGCVIIGDPYTALLSQETVGFRTNGGQLPKVGDVYWAHLWFGVFTNLCTPGAAVTTEIALPANTFFALGPDYPGYGVHCWYYPAGGGAAQEVTNDPNAGCPTTPAAGTWATSLGTRVVAGGAMFEIQFPLVSTAPLGGMADANSKLTGVVYESIAVSGLTVPYQWVSVAAQSPSIGYPNPSTTGIQAGTAHSVANLANHYIAGNAWFDIGTTAAYGRSDGPVAIGTGTNSVQVYSDWDGLLPNTTYHWRLRFVTATATYTGADQVFTTAPDTTPPTAKPPTARISGAARLGASTVPYRVTWPAGTDDSGGPVTYRLQQRTQPPGGSWGAWTTAGSWTSSRAATRDLQPGSFHQFRVEVKDAAGNVATSTASRMIRPLLRQENSTAIAYGGLWRRAARAGASGGSASWASAAGATATLTFTGRSVAVVMPRGQDLGKAEIWVDGAKAATVDLYRTTTDVRRIVYARAWTSASAHTVVVKVLGTRNPASAGTRAWLDAIVTD